MQKYLSISEAAKEKQTARNTVARWIKEGKLTVELIAGRRVIVQDDKYTNMQTSRAGGLASRVAELENQVAQLRSIFEKLQGKN
jgi:predicted site-specific integrase-resolvase